MSRRLKKNLKMFIIVHPSWFIRTLLGITRPFIRSQSCNCYLHDSPSYWNSFRFIYNLIAVKVMEIFIRKDYHVAFSKTIFYCNCFWFLFPSVPSSAVRSSMCIVCRSSEKSFLWSMCIYLTALSGEPACH